MRTYSVQNVMAIRDMAQHHVLAVALGRSSQGQVELAGVGVLARVGHSDHPLGIMQQLQALPLIVELAAIDGVAPAPVTCTNRIMGSGPAWMSRVHLGGLGCDPVKAAQA